MAVLAWVSLPLGAGATGGGGGGGPCPGFASGSTIELRDSCFAGTAHLVSAGILTVRNTGLLEHDVTAVGGEFATKLRPGQERTLTLDRPGAFRVFCTLHGTASGQGMAGLIVVSEPATEGAALTAAASHRGAPPTAGGDGIRVSSFTLGGLTVAAALILLAAARKRFLANRAGADA